MKNLIRIAALVFLLPFISSSINPIETDTINYSDQDGKW